MKKSLIIIMAALLTGCFDQTYTVERVSSHHPSRDGGNSQTHLMVYKSGNSGHVKKVFCHFAPDVGHPYNVTKVKVGGVAEVYMFGEEARYCYVEASRESPYARWVAMKTAWLEKNPGKTLKDMFNEHENNKEQAQ